MVTWALAEFKQPVEMGLYDRLAATVAAHHGSYNRVTRRMTKQALGKLKAYAKREGMWPGSTPSGGNKAMAAAGL